MTVIVKLGGSVITDKSATETVDRDGLARAVAAIGTAERSDVVVVHGGGSFGHPAAEKHGVSRTTGTRNARVVKEIGAAMDRLNEAVIEAFHGRSMPAVHVDPMGMAERTDKGRLNCAAVGVRRLLAEGFIPVLHGAVIGHADEGCSIASGDELVVALAIALRADRLGFCTNVPGVLDESGSVIARLEASTDFGTETAQETTDVTGGMAGKVRALAHTDVPAAIFDLQGLPGFLDGGMPGTVVV